MTSTSELSYLFIVLVHKRVLRALRRTE